MVIQKEPITRDAHLPLAVLRRLAAGCALPSAPDPASCLFVNAGALCRPLNSTFVLTTEWPGTPSMVNLITCMPQSKGSNTVGSERWCPLQAPELNLATADHRVTWHTLHGDLDHVCRKRTNSRSQLR